MRDLHIHHQNPRKAGVSLYLEVGALNVAGTHFLCVVPPSALRAAGQLHHTTVTAAPFAGSCDFAGKVVLRNLGIGFSAEREKQRPRLCTSTQTLGPALLWHTKGSFQRHRLGLCFVLGSRTYIINPLCELKP